MEKLFEKAIKKCEAAEILLKTYKKRPIIFENSRLKNIQLADYFEIGLRIIRKGRIGFSYATSFGRRSSIIKEAVEMAKNGAPVNFNFSAEQPTRIINNYDSTLENIDLKDVVRDAIKIIKWFKPKRISAPIFCTIELNENSVAIINSSGIKVKSQSTGVNSFCTLLLEGSQGGPYVYNSGPSYQIINEEQLAELYELFLLSQKLCSIPTRPMKVLFRPPSMHTIFWRVISAVSAQSLIEKITPLADKLDQKIGDERLTIVDNPHLAGQSSSRPFDDEGVPTRITPIIEKGVFKNFLFDLKTASMLSKKSSGNGYRFGMWGRDITVPVTPYPLNPLFEPGDVSYQEMIKRMDEGLILEIPNGAHSGNIPAGDFSVNVGLGYYVKGGVIQGRAEDAMIAGNIYGLFQNLNCISREVDCNNVPSLLFDNVGVAGRS